MIAALPAATVAEKTLIDAAQRFWGGLITAAGKPAYHSVEVRKIRRPKIHRQAVSREVSIFGFSKRQEQRDDGWVEIREVKVARWEVAVGVVAGAILLAETNKGQAHLANAKTKLGWNPQPLSLHGLGSSGGSTGPTLSAGYGGIFPGATGWGLIKW